MLAARDPVAMSPTWKKDEHELEVTETVEELMRIWYDIYNSDPKGSQKNRPVTTASSDGTKGFRRGVGEVFDEEFPYFLWFKCDETEALLFNISGSKDSITTSTCWHHLDNRTM